MNTEKTGQSTQGHCLNKKEQLVQIFKTILEKDGFNEADIYKYFHPNYIQYVDNKILRFDEFIAHIKVLKATVSQVTIDFDHLIEEGNKVSSVHYVKAKKANGVMVKAKVIAMFQFKEDQLVMCDELTYLISGEASDADLGSRHTNVN
ncbi:nuclear transport factor 2 family protein [Cysteiniphilum halobium]|uniref:nuclear transport factor 2 family protein n=1 Tax=Cysteiniphilum halobium TaxID=2219059 RepID=UPI000E65234B|nr:nuclear transport factor 2 family protein [Cysteiniphilum halobium]